MEEQYLAIALSANRTRKQYGSRHFCTVHNKILDKNHLDDCTLLAGKWKPTEFNNDIKLKQVNDFETERLMELKDHLCFLNARIQKMESKKLFICTSNTVV